jgi:hypothetical protein
MSRTLDGGGENIAAPADGFDQLGVPAVIFQLAAEARHGDINRAVKGSCLAAAKQVKQHIAR